MNNALVASIVTALVVGAVVAIVVRSIGRRELRNRAYDSAMRLGLDLGPSGTARTVDELLLAIERSVRDLRAADSAHEATELRLRSALDGLPEAVLVFDSDGTILEHNAAAEPLIEARHGDALVGAALTELVRTAIAGEQASRSLDLFGPPRRSVVITTVPMMGTGDPGAIAFVEDITDRRQLEAVRTDFVANISHELKTPVGAIGLLAETLQAEDDPVIVERLATRIHNESMRIAGLIEDLLVLSRIETRALPDFVPVSLLEIISETVDGIGPAAKRGDVTIGILPIRGSDVILGDRRQLISAFANLIENAVKYSDPGSSVEVEIAGMDDEVVVRITDHGIGIPTKDIERIFERFYRVDQARSRQTGGTGLGLSIVRHVVVNHDASVEVESRLGEGSTFRLRFRSGDVSVMNTPEVSGNEYVQERT